MSWQNLTQMFEELYWINEEQRKSIDEYKNEKTGKKEKSMKLSDLNNIKGMGKLD